MQRFYKEAKRSGKTQEGEYSFEKGSSRRTISALVKSHLATKGQRGTDGNEHYTLAGQQVIFFVRT